MFISKLSIKEYWDEDDERCMNELADKGHIVGFHSKPFPNLQFYGHRSKDSYRSFRFGYRKHSGVLRGIGLCRFFMTGINPDVIDSMICDTYID